MKSSRAPAGHRTVPFPATRRLVAASVSVNRERNTIHGLTEVDITVPRRRMREQRERMGETLSFTAYVVACFARAVAEQPALNAFRKGRRLVLLDDITVSTLVEREVGGEKIPEPCPIHAAHLKSHREIHEEIRAAQRHRSDRLGSLSGSPRLLALLPETLARSFVRLAARSTAMAKRYGVLGVTAVGMFGGDATWAIPLSAATVTLTVGSIVTRPVLREGQLEEREHLCLTFSFNHDLIDGAPAARFMKRMGEILAAGDLLGEAARE